MPRRRGHHEGTIYETAAGRFRAQVSLTAGRRVSKTFDTRRDAQRWIIATLKADQDGLPVIPERITLAGFLDRWLQDVVAHTARPKTLLSYESLVRVHIRPALGSIRLNQLRPDMLQRFYSDKLQTHSPRTVRYLHAVLHRALNQAVRWQLVPRNVADAVDPPSVKRKNMAALAPAQARQFLAAVREDRFYALYLLAITTGMRQGELLGLRWSDVDLAAGRLSVSKSIQRLWKRGLILTDPKTDQARRTITLTPAVVAAFRTRRIRYLEERLLAGDRWKDHNLVFCSTVGTPTEPRNLVTFFHAALERAGLPRIRFHDLRHTAATLMLSQGTHPKVVQEVLGHADVTLTLNTYSHVLPTMQEEAAERMQRMLDG